MTTVEERIAALEGAYEHLATKADLARLEASLRAELSTMEKSLRAEMGGLAADIAALHATMQTAAWAIGLGLGVVGLLVAILALPRVLESFGRSPRQRRVGGAPAEADAQGDVG